MRAPGRTARRLSAGLAALFLIALAAALAPQDAQAQEKPALTATAGVGSVTLTWTRTGNTGFGYWVYRQGVTGGGYGDWIDIPGGATIRTHTVTGLTAGTSYTFQVARAEGTGLNFSVFASGGGYSNGATATPMAAASTKTITLSATSTSITEGNSGSTDVTVTATLGEAAPADFSITLGSDITNGTAQGSNKGLDQCTAPLNPADSDWCWPNSDASVSIAAGETEGTRTLRILGDTRDEPNETIRLLAYKTGWTSGRLTLTIVDDDDPPTTTVPAKPAGLSAEAGNRQVKLTWTDPDDDSITRYNMRQKKGAAAWGSWTAIPGSDADTTTYTVTGLDNDVEYRFRIRARNSGGNSAQSEVVEATPSASAAVPKPVLSAEPGYARVTLSWSALSGVTVASWGYQYKPAGGSWIRTRTVTGGSTTSTTVTGLTIGTEYTFRLFAAVGPGVQSVWSDQVKATPTNTVPKPVLTAAGGDASVTLSWSALTGIPITSWGYQYKSTGGWSTTTTLTGGSRTSVRVTGLTKGTDYTFRLFAAVSPGVQSVWSDEVTAKTDPVAPVLTAATSTTSQRVDLTWTHAGGSDEMTDADDYVRNAVRFHWWGAQIRLKGETAWRDETLSKSVARAEAGSRSNQISSGDAYPDGASVEVRVRASGYDSSNAVLNGPWSNIRTVSFKNTKTGAAALTITDAPVTVAPGATATYKVKLTKAYAGTLRITSDDTAAARVSPSSLTFTTSNYNTARTVRVTGVANGTATINHAFRLTGASADAIPDAGTVDVTVADTPGVTVSTAALTVAEGGSRTYTMRLNTPPTSDVTITVAGASGDVTVTGSPLTFTRTDWNQPQTVTVNAGTDTDTDTDPAVTLTHSASGGGYGSVSIADVVVRVAEKDAAPLKPTDFSAAAGNGSVTLSWTDPDNPTITKWQYRYRAAVAGALMASQGPGPVRRQADWTWRDIPGSGPTTTSYEVSGLDNGTAYQFEVRAVNGAGSGAGPDAPADATPAAPTTTSGGGGGGSGEGSGSGGSTTTSGTKGVTVSLASVRVTEGGAAVYTVILDRRPSGNVTVTVSGASGDVTVSPGSLTFTRSNWDTAQTVTVRAAEDADAVADSVTLTHEASGGGYGSVEIADVSVRVTENDEAGVAVTPTELMVDEGGSGTYTVALTSEPTAEVTVAIGGAAGDITVAPVSLGFTAANWDTAQTVTVSAAEDADAVADTATLTHEVSGGDYDSVKADAVAVRVTDNDKAGVTVTPTELTVDEGGSGTYTVVLTSEPTGPVTVTPTSSDGGAATVSGALGFTAANWDTPQTVTVSGVEDEDSLADMMATVSHQVSGGDYGGVTADSVSVTVRNTTSAEALGRANRLNEVILPQFAAGFATQTLGAVADRIESVSAGHAARELRLGATPMSASSGGALDLRHDGRTGAFGDRTAFGGQTHRPLRLADVLDGAAFGMTLGQEEEEGGFPAIGVWGRGGRLSLSGADREVSWDGGLWSAHVGADMRIGSDLLAGIVVSHATGDFDATSAAATGSVAGLYEAGLTSAHPYLAWLAPDGSNLWASGGYGRGEVRVTETGMSKRDAGMSFASGALGGRSVLFRDADLLVGGMTRLALKGEGSYARFTTASESGLEGLTAHTSRLRLMLEGSHERPLGTGTLTPALEVGVLYDRGDAVEGAGVEVGGSVAYRMRDPGLTVEVRSRALVTHAETDRREWGVGAMVSLDPGDEGRGPFLKVAPSQGGTESGLQQMFDRSPAFSPTPMAGLRSERRLTAEGGHGFGLPLAGVLTPYAGLQMAEMGRAVRLGARYQLGPLFRLDLEGARRESVMGTRDRQLALQGALSW